MVRLKECFMKRGNKYTQVYRNDDMALYLVDNEHEWYYEVFKIKVNKPNKYVDDEYEPYPGDESFGVWAWCCSNKKSLEKVLKKHFPNKRMEDIFKNAEITVQYGQISHFFLKGDKLYIQIKNNA